MWFDTLEEGTNSPQGSKQTKLERSLVIDWAIWDVCIMFFFSLFKSAIGFICVLS